MAKNIDNQADFDTVVDTKREEKALVKMLQNRPKVRVRIPLPSGMSREMVAAQVAKGGQAPFEVVGINGYNYQIRLGEDVMVPDLVSNILREANKI